MLDEAEKEAEQSVPAQLYAKGLHAYLAVAVPIDKKVRWLFDCTGHGEVQSCSCS